MSPTLFTPEQIDKIIADLKENLGGIRVLNDVIMKHLLGEPGKTEERLLDFINAVRTQTKQTLIEQVVIEHSTNFPDSPDGKITFLDIKARDENGVWYNIEVQLGPRKYFIDRVVYYNSKVYVTQIVTGDNYDKLLPTISIIITDEVLFEKLPGAFQVFRITSETDPSYVLTDRIQFCFLQLGKGLTQESLSGLAPELVNWVHVLNFPLTSEVTMKTALSESPVLVGTANALAEFVADAATRNYLEDMEMHRRDYEWAMRCERLEGLAEGEARGKVDALRHVLVARFQKVPKRIDDRISQIGDLVVLDSLTVAAATCQSLAEFEEALA
ncbi:MAG: Rpn family recombination-promoting nuclease/putative transposase [Thermoguttaceae bacterium]